MKYLLSWVSSHLKVSNWRNTFTIKELVKKISHHVAEVSSYKYVSYEKIKIHVGTVISNHNNICLAQLDKEEKIIHLPFWKDAITGSRYLIIDTEENKYRFATMQDFHSENKNHYVGPLYGTLEDQLLFVKELQKRSDYILHIDNTAISNRPDLFSQRGLAREISCLYNIPLIPESEIILDKTKYKKNISKNIFTNLSEKINSIGAATVSFNEQESILEYLVPLCHLDVTPHSFLVDLSNYVMMDIGQPLHVFDKKKVKNPLIFSEKASGNMICLDNTTITIQENAITIQSENKIHSLVGIIGGKESSVTRNTKEIIIESASLPKKYISTAIKLFNKKTESAIRNEKGSPAYGPEMALFRFLFLLKKEFGIEPEQIQLFSKNEDATRLVISSQYISNVIGVTVSKEKITHLLEGLGFILHLKKNTNAEDSILVDIPWWRLDINNQDDIAEEIVRHIGFNNIPHNPPSLPCRGHYFPSLIQNLKKYTAILGKSHEVISYGIAHEEVKKRWNYISNKEEIPLKNPYSSFQTTLTSSHIPAFLDIIYKEIKAGASELSIFEINPLWYKKNNNIEEEITYSIAFYKEHADYNFYEYKNIIRSIFESIDYKLVWDQYNNKNTPHNLYSDISAHITYNGSIIGIAGFIDPIILYKEIKKKGSIFAAEITVKNLLNQKNNSEKTTKPSFFDVSILIKKSDQAKMIIDQLNTAFGNIMNIEIIDWFESPEWPTQRSITLRIYIFNRDINDNYTEITQYLMTQGYRLR